MTIDLKEALLNLTEKGEKGYTKEIEKLDKFTEEIVVVVRNLSERTREAVDIMEEVKTVIGDHPQ